MCIYIYIFVCAEYEVHVLYNLRVFGPMPQYSTCQNMFVRVDIRLYLSHGISGEQVSLLFIEM